MLEDDHEEEANGGEFPEEEVVRSLRVTVAPVPVGGRVCVTTSTYCRAAPAPCSRSIDKREREQGTGSALTVNLGRAGRF